LVGSWNADSSLVCYGHSGMLPLKTISLQCIWLCDVCFVTEYVATAAASSYLSAFTDELCVFCCAVCLVLNS